MCQQWAHSSLATVAQNPTQVAAAREFASAIYSLGQLPRFLFSQSLFPNGFTSDSASKPFDWRQPWYSLGHTLRAYKANFIHRGHPPWHSPVNYGRPPVEVDPTCLRRWRLAGMAPRHTSVRLDHVNPDLRYPLIVPVATLQSSLDMYSDSDNGGLINVAVSSILPAVYGMPHLLGWNAVFPSHTEQVLWRTAALAVTVSGCVTFVFAILLGIMGIIRNGDTNYVLRSPLVTLLPYVAASGYLLVESFRQLFSLPPGAFQLASWANMIPHFS